MKRTPALPRLWLFTDERLGIGRPSDPLWPAIGRLPPGGGILFRHYGLPAADRLALLRQVAVRARARRLLLVVSDPPPGWRARHRHWPAHAVAHASMGAGGIHTAAAHSARELEAAARAGADLVFLSPLFPTRSHPAGRTLGPVRFGLILHGRSRGAARVPVVALGGMNRDSGRMARALGAFGWAAIDAWAGAR